MFTLPFNGATKRIGPMLGTALGLPASGFARRFATDRRGNVAMIFAGMIIPVSGLVGMSVDLAAALRVRTQVQAALDSAALAGGREFQVGGNVSAAQSAAERYFFAALPADSGVEITTNAVDTDTSTIELAARKMMKTKFLGLIGFSELEVSTNASASLAQGGIDKNLEVSMMLDVTGSMSGQKIADLKIAAKDLINILVQDDQSEFLSRIAIVPFSEGVRPGNAYINTVRGTPPATFAFKDSDGDDQEYELSKCVSERLGDQKFTDAAPGEGKYLGAVYTSSGGCSPSQAIVPLSSNRTTLNAKIDSLAASGYTAGHIGTAWAWYTISPNWVDVWPEGSKPAAINAEETLKVAVLMTDGEYNTQYKNGVQTRTIGGASPNGSSDSQARQLCTAMKNAGITVYTVGFMLNDANAIETLEQCASSTSNAFVAENGAQLKQAFRQIAFKLAELRLTK